jgi:hypothetical protein
MPTCLDPELSGSYQNWPIEVKRPGSCPTDSRPANDSTSRFHPEEMLFPVLLPRVEQSDRLTGFRIESGNPVALEGVTSRTGQPQVFLDGGTSESLWNQMIDLHRETHDPFRAQAVPAAAAGLFSNTLAKLW